MASRVVPNMSADTVPITGLPELQAHLDELVDEPTTPLNPKLFDDVELQLTEANTLPVLPALLPRLTQILKTTPHDPAVPISLSLKLLAPLSFTQTLSLAGEESLLTALTSPSPAANILAMAIVSKAAASPSDAAILSMMPRVIEEFLRRWLAAPQVEVGEKGSKVLGDILDTDCELAPQPVNGVNGTEVVVRKPPGQGRMWRRIFLDREMLSLLISHCRGAVPDQTTHQTTLAQGRLLRLLPRLAALNFPAVASSPFPELTGGDGLLHFAALRMVDKDDMLMHLSLIDFFETFISIMRVTEYSARKMEEIQKVVAEATSEDKELETAILSLPDRTVPEEAELLRRWIGEVMEGG